MIFEVVFLALFALSWAARGTWPRVVGGVPDDAGEFPFAVLLELAVPPMSRKCSGSLIAPTWMLTAAHCLPVIGTETSLRIRYGDFTILPNNTNLYMNVIKALKPPTSITLGHRANSDIALLKIGIISNMPLAKLSAVDYAAFMGLPVKYAGFGMNRLKIKGKNQSKHTEPEDLHPPLSVGEAVVISCKQDGGLGFMVPLICLAPRCGPRQQPYFGDSGGPLLYDGRIIAVCSGTKDTRLPLVGYTPISPYLNWIQDTMKSD